MRFLHTTRLKQLILLPILLCFLMVNTGQAQLLLKDINTGTGNAAPSNFTEMNGIIYFEATTAAAGKELWRSDGTAVGTYILKDINPGSGSTTFDDMVVMGGNLYFIANDLGTTYGKELWKSDGTAVGTVPLDIVTGTGSSNPDYLVVMNGMLYFAASNGTDGEELWKSDGTLANTVQLKDINTGAASPSSSNPAELTVYNNEIYFRANNDTNGSELWKSNGTAGGTFLLSDINTTTGSSPKNFCVANGLLFFSANGSAGEELYKTNGTTVGLIDINSGAGNSNPETMVEFNNELYFSAADNGGVKQLWRSNGTTTTVHSSGITNPDHLFASGTKLFLEGNNNLKIVETDGTVETVNVNSPQSFTSYKNRVFFVVENGGAYNIWISDGTATGTKLAMEVDVMQTAGKYELEVAGNNLYFPLDDATNGTEVSLIGDCDPDRPGTTMSMAKSAGLHSSLFETTDANDWTHYCDCANNILLSLNKTGTGAVIESDSVSVKIEATLATLYNSNVSNAGGEACDTCFISAEYGAVLFNRSWDVRPSTQPVSNVPVRFYFAEEEYDAVQSIMTDIFGTPMSDPTDMSFFKVTSEGLGQHPEISTIGVGDAVILTNGISPGLNTWKKESYISTTDFYSEFLVSSFSGGGGGSGSGSSGPEALPVELTYFKAAPIQKQNEVYLEWATASELNNKGFFIERSFDSRNWQVIGFEYATEKPVFPAVYQFTDKNPQAGDNYYRLKQQDFDGKTELSKVKHVSMDLFIVGNIFPNPVSLDATVMIDITTPTSSSATVEVFDLSRQLLIQNQHDLAQGPQLIPLELKNLPAGMYIVKVESKGVVVNTKVLVQE